MHPERAWIAHSALMTNTWPFYVGCTLTLSAKNAKTSQLLALKVTGKRAATVSRNAMRAL